MIRYHPHDVVADQNWGIEVNPNGSVSPQDAKLAVLMDIRAQLKKLNALLHCPNFLAIPKALQAIQRNTKKRRRKPRG